MQINPLKVGAWGMVGGLTAAAICRYESYRWIRGCARRNNDPEPNLSWFALSDNGEVFAFAIGAVCGAIFKCIGLPAIQGAATIFGRAGRGILDQRERVYNATKWFFTS